MKIGAVKVIAFLNIVNEICPTFLCRLRIHLKRSNSPKIPHIFVKIGAVKVMVFLNIVNEICLHFYVDYG